MNDHERGNNYRSDMMQIPVIMGAIMFTNYTELISAPFCTDPIDFSFCWDLGPNNWNKSTQSTWFLIQGSLCLYIQYRPAHHKQNIKISISLPLLHLIGYDIDKYMNQWINLDWFEFPMVPINISMQYPCQAGQLYHCIFLSVWICGEGGDNWPGGCN